MAEFLFAYGTLRPGLAPSEIAAAAARLRLVGEAWVAGELYDLGHYPGVVLGNDPASKVFGLLFELPDDASVLPALDEYEEFLPDLPDASQFLRVKCEAALADGSSITCWIYVYARSLAGARQIDDGRWPGPAE
jgi:gamma-glutamylcyclotransferase (GGCT)/AIG2-like uncharacterized protein YtfP